MCAKRESCAIEAPETTRAFDPKAYARIENCALYAVKQGAVQVRYRHKGMPVTPILVVNEKILDLFKKFPPDRCGVSSKPCLQERMNRMDVTPAGKGIDSAKSSPGGAGQPCDKGLPCGIILPPAADWHFQLSDRAVRGRLELTMLRGTARPGGSTQLTFPVVDGEVRADGRALQPSAVYGYRLVQADGGIAASGEFSILGTNAMATLKRLAEQSAEKNGLSVEAAWLDALSANELDWDLNRMIAER